MWDTSYNPANDLTQKFELKYKQKKYELMLNQQFQGSAFSEFMCKASYDINRDYNLSLEY